MEVKVTAPNARTAERRTRSARKVESRHDSLSFFLAKSEKFAARKYAVARGKNSGNPDDIIIRRRRIRRNSIYTRAEFSIEAGSGAISSAAVSIAFSGARGFLPQLIYERYNLRLFYFNRGNTSCLTYSSLNLRLSRHSKHILFTFWRR